MPGRPEPDHILLTGATGFIGSFLLAELYERTRAQIHCLVRCRDEVDGRARIAQTLTSARLPQLASSSRIVPLPGDLSKPLLGLTDDEFHGLAATTDAVYHCGALVNFLYPYSYLKDTNVLGTQEIIRLATKLRSKRLHFVSSLRVFGSFGSSDSSVISEESSLDHDCRLYSGYAQSKWVAEKLVRLAQDRGLPVSIYRPGMVTGHSETGVSNVSDILCRMIKSCIQLGSIPALDILVDVTPVDFVAQAIVHLSIKGESLGKTFHLVTPDPIHWNTIADWLQSFGYPLRRISFDAWRGELLNAARQSGDNALAPLVLLLLDEIPSLALREFACRNTLQGLADSAIACPRMQPSLLATYLEYFAASGFLERPPAVGRSGSELVEGIRR